MCYRGNWVIQLKKVLLKVVVLFLLKIQDILSNGCEKEGSESFYVGYNIIVNTLSSPLSQILSNCGVGVDTEIIEHIKKSGGGYDAKRMKNM